MTKAKIRRVVKSLVNPSIIWLTLIPMLWVKPYMVFPPLAITFGLMGTYTIMTSIINPSFSRPHGVLPALMILLIVAVQIHINPFLAVSINPLTISATILAAIWGLFSVKKCPMVDHPVCKEYQFTNMMMLISCIIYIIGFLISLWLSYNTKAITIGTLCIPWACHSYRIWRQGFHKTFVNEPDTNTNLRPHTKKAYPIIRIASICGESLLLCKDSEGYYDHPIQVILQPNETRQRGLNRLLNDHGITQKPRLLLRYYYTRNNEVDQLVYLYVLNNPYSDSSSLSCSTFNKDDFAQSKSSYPFSPMLIEEHRYLCHTIFLSNTLTYPSDSSVGTFDLK